LFDLWFSLAAYSWRCRRAGAVCLQSGRQTPLPRLGHPTRRLPQRRGAGAAPVAPAPLIQNPTRPTSRRLCSPVLAHARTAKQSCLPYRASSRWMQVSSSFCRPSPSIPLARSSRVSSGWFCSYLLHIPTSSSASGCVEHPGVNLAICESVIPLSPSVQPAITLKTQEMIRA
jgi:hypothetical protein